MKGADAAWLRLNPGATLVECAACGQTLATSNWTPELRRLWEKRHGLCVVEEKVGDG